MEQILSSMVAAFFIRLCLFMIFPKIHNSKSIYWDVSFLVGIVGIIGYIITQGIYVDEYNNIGRAIGFFSVDLIHGPSVSRRTTKKS